MTDLLSEGLAILVMIIAVIFLIKVRQDGKKYDAFLREKPKWDYESFLKDNPCVTISFAKFEMQYVANPSKWTFQHFDVGTANVKMLVYDKSKDIYFETYEDALRGIAYIEDIEQQNLLHNVEENKKYLTHEWNEDLREYLRKIDDKE